MGAVNGDFAVDEEIHRFPAIAADDDFRTLVYLYAREYENALREIERDADNDKVRFWMIWSDFAPGLRDDPYFPTFVKNTGLLDYWRGFGFPPRCRPVGEDSFTCE